MACILHIETTTQVCSVALSQDGICLFEKEDRNGPSHAVVLAPFVEEAVSFADSHAIPLDAVAVSCGPGSYTGLRIGVSMAKAVAYALGHRSVDGQGRMLRPQCEIGFDSDTRTFMCSGTALQG